MGNGFLLKTSAEDGSNHFDTIAGLREDEVTIDNGAMTICATGIYLGDKSESMLRTMALSGTLGHYELSYEDGQRLRGDMLVLRLDYLGHLNGEANYRVTLSSAGSMVPV